MINHQEIPRPNYWFSNNKVPKLQKSYVSKFFRYARDEFYDQARTEYMDHSLRERIGNKLSAIRNRRQASRMPFAKEVTGRDQDRRLALFTLHKQPEASIDVIGGLHTNQLSLIETVSKSLPVDYLLLVKEHSNAIGDRGREFYEAVCSLGNVRLIDPWADSRELLKKAEAVFTVSGTIAMEASLMRRNALTFAECFFSHMPMVQYIRNPAYIPDMLRSKPEPEASDYYKFYNDLITNSFEGLIGDPVCFPESMEHENVGLVADAFRALLKHLESGVAVAKA